MWTLLAICIPNADRDHLVLHSAGLFAEAVPRLRACPEGKIAILSALRHFAAANVPEM
jgi:hypothetical protein